jgi:hypothetical protein
MQRLDWVLFVMAMVVYSAIGVSALTLMGYLALSTAGDGGTWLAPLFGG